MKTIDLGAWVSVVSKLPDTNARVLCSVGWGDGTRYVAILTWILHERHFEDVDGAVYLKVTHWMPLPDLAVEG